MTPRSEPVRLLIVNSTFHVGGAERIAACLAESLDRRRFDVAVCYLKETGVESERLRRNGVTVLPIPGLQPGKPDYLSSLKLRRLVRSRKTEILHSHDLHSFVDASICRRLVPGLTHVHTFHFGNYPFRERRYIGIERVLWRGPDVLVAVGHAQADSIGSLYGIPAERLTVIWNGIDAAPSAARAANVNPETQNAAPVIASISTLIPQKGIEILLEAAAMLRHTGERFRLLIAGDGVLKESLLRQVKAGNLEECVQFLGWVPHAAERLLHDCDIFVQSSHWEAMSVVVLEAMAAGKPIVVTRVGDNARVLADRESALLVPPGDASKLADSLRTLLRDPGLASRLGANAKLRHSQRFRAQHMVAAYEQIYLELASGARAPAKRQT